MPRQARQASGTGIYHVMMRGINHQNIFEEQEDYMRMLRCMQLMLEQYDDLGNRLLPLCMFYAYCLMSNHVRMLLKVNQEDIGSTIKHLAVKTAVMFYNTERPHSSIDYHTPDEAHQMQGEMKRHWHSWREDAIKRQNAMAV